jgi:hypothetical protein
VSQTVGRMTIEDDLDVPYGENFHDEAVAAEWAEAAARKRPWRRRIFDHFVTALYRARPSPSS